MSNKTFVFVLCIAAVIGAAIFAAHKPQPAKEEAYLLSPTGKALNATTPELEAKKEQEDTSVVQSSDQTCLISKPKVTKISGQVVVQFMVEGINPQASQTLYAEIAAPGIIPFTNETQVQIVGQPPLIVNAQGNITTNGASASMQPANGKFTIGIRLIQPAKVALTCRVI